MWVWNYSLGTCTALAKTFIFYWKRSSNVQHSYSNVGDLSSILRRMRDKNDGYSKENNSAVVFLLPCATQFCNWFKYTLQRFEKFSKRPSKKTLLTRSIPILVSTAAFHQRCLMLITSWSSTWGSGCFLQWQITWRWEHHTHPYAYTFPTS